MADRLGCSDPPDSILADADIVGPGVLAAFMITATVTILVIIFAYLSDSLDDDLQGILDQSIIDNAQRRFRHLKRVSTNLSNSPPSRDKAMREARKEAITQFILTLSDQQLVTGLGILISCIMDPRHITGYEFTVATALAWFSSTTHLATLTALRGYMRSHGPVRDARVVGMVLVLLLLVYAVFVSVFAAGSTAPILCRFRESVGGIIAPFGIIGIIALVAVVLPVLAGYMVRIQDLYFGQADPLFMVLWIPWRLCNVWNGTAALPYRVHFAERRAKYRLNAVLRAKKWIARPPSWTTNYLRNLSQSILLFEDSFLSTMPTLAFTFSYGVTQIALFRWVEAPQLEAESNRMGFGQVMSLLLLLLPCLAAGESYYDYRNKQHDASKVQSAPDISASPAPVAQPPLTKAQAMAVVDRIFDRKVGRIQRYFAQEVRCLVHEGPQDDADEISRRKATLLAKYDMIERFLQTLDRRPVFTLFFTRLFLSLVLGVLLNTIEPMLNLPGTLVFLASVAFDVGMRIEEAFEMLKHMIS